MANITCLPEIVILTGCQTPVANNLLFLTIKGTVLLAVNLPEIIPNYKYTSKI